MLSSFSESNEIDVFQEINVEVCRETPEQCIETINQLERVIARSHKRVLYSAAIQGELLATLREVYGSAFARIVKNNIDISRSHAFFLMRFSKAACKYPRLLKCNLPLNFFVKNMAKVEDVCQTETFWCN